jgi:hypothetical protein
MSPPKRKRYLPPRPIAPTPKSPMGEGAPSLSGFTTPAGEAFVDINVDGHRETYAVNAPEFRLVLAVQSLRNGKPLTAPHLRMLIDEIHAKARDPLSPVRDVYRRAACCGDEVFVDLCNKEWSAVRITPSGWSIVTEPPVRFVRTPGMGELPVPVLGGTIDDLREHINVRDDGAFILLVSWMMHAVWGDRDFPILLLTGNEGAAKSTLKDVVCLLIDPRVDAPRGLSLSASALDRSFHNYRVAAFDNVSNLSPATLDTLCRRSTGDGSQPIVLTGTADAVFRPDVIDRCIIIVCDEISESRRKTSKQTRSDFLRARPSLLGALFTVLAHGLGNATSDGELPRMADFALCGIKCEAAFNVPGSFLRAYKENRAAVLSDLLSASPIGDELLSFLARRRRWVGTATELSTLLGSNSSSTKPATMAPRIVSQELRKLTGCLRRAGIVVNFSRHGRSGVRVIMLTDSRTDNEHGELTLAAAKSTSEGEAAGRVSAGGDGAGIDLADGDGRGADAADAAEAADAADAAEAADAADAVNLPYAAEAAGDVVE